MANETIDWSGASGKQYKYFVNKLPCSFNSGQLGNYIFTRLEGNLWTPIYIGEGDLGERIGPGHHQWECISSKRATHVHVHTSASKAASRAEEADLLANYSQAYKPDGCNERDGG